MNFTYMTGVPRRFFVKNPAHGARYGGSMKDYLAQHKPPRLTLVALAVNTLLKEAK